MPLPTHPDSLNHRLVAELVRIREEAAGHPADSPGADRVAIEGAGELAHRVARRARELPGADRLAATVRGVLLTGLTLASVLLALAALAGIAAAQGALDATRPASLPLVLMVVVGMNMFTLLLWVLAQVLSRRITPGLGTVLRGTWQRFAPRPAGGNGAEAAHQILRLVAAGPVGRWLMGSMVHAAWLVFGLASLATLAVLLSVRSYELAWATTLLDDEALATWARALSWGPALLGVHAPQGQSVVDTASPAARQAWSYWLLTAVLVYGLVPRALALALCTVQLVRAQASLGRDMLRPGFARLRARLMPDRLELGVVDPAQGAPAQGPPDAGPAEPTPPAGIVHGLWLDGSPAQGAPQIPGIQWVWLGTVDEAASRKLALGRLRDEPVAALAIVVRASMTPDRGVGRFVADACTAARAPTQVVLAQFERLEARGVLACRQRLDDWQAMARSAGASGGVLPWRGGYSRPDEPSPGLQT